MCRLISVGIVLTKQVSVKSEVLSKTKSPRALCAFFFCSVHVKHMSVISQVLHWKWHQNPGGLALWDRLFDMIPENREFSKKERSCFRLCCWFRGGKKTFYTNSGDELEDAAWFFHWIFIIVAVSRENAMICVAKLQFNVTRVIIVTFAGADGEMFVSRDYNYNHSVIWKRRVVVFDWPPCWNHFTVLCCIFSKWHQPAHNRTQVHNVKLEL